MTEVEYWTLILRGLTAVGTLFVAIMAIWGEWVRSLIASPKLVLTIHHPEGELVEQTDGKTVYPARYYHPKVTNQRKWVQAKNVRVMVNNIIRQTPGKDHEYGAISSPLQLTWQFPQIHPMYPTIGPGDICDLGYVVKLGKFRLSPYIIPLKFYGELNAGQTMLIMIVAKADNAESKPLSVEIYWDGLWHDDAKEMQNHLRIKEVKNKTLA